MPVSRHRAAVAAVAVGGVAAVAATIAALGARRWDCASAHAVARLRATAAAAPPRAHDAEDDLPAPVRRYLALALAPGPRPTAVRLDWRGEFRMRPGGAWRPFAAEQHVVASPPGFVWNASIRLAPLVAVRVRDGYALGEGTMRAAVAGVVPVVDVRGTPEMAAGALARWLAEAVWLPTALLPRDGLTWTSIDDRTARATLVDRGVTVAADFHFGDGGEIVGVSGERYRDVDGVGVATRWRARVWDHARLAGMLVPRHGEVEWLLSDGPFAYWRGRLAGASYDAAHEPTS